MKASREVDAVLLELAQVSKDRALAVRQLEADLTYDGRARKGAEGAHRFVRRGAHRLQGPACEDPFRSGPLRWGKARDSRRSFGSGAALDCCVYRTAEEGPIVQC